MEVAIDDISVPISVKGRLRDNLMFWKEVLEAPPAVLDIIESGYVLPLMSELTPFSGKNHSSALQDYQFVSESIEQLVSAGCVREVEEPPVVVSPLSVAENSERKKRLVVNLRHVDKFLYKQRFKYEDLRTAMVLIEKGIICSPLI